MFLGIQIGDALGMPVESRTAKEIKEKYGRIERMISPKDHKYLSDNKAGTYTDDTQLTLAVAKGLIADPLNMDSQVKFHLDAFNKSTSGWGRSTREAVSRLANGCTWQTSGQLNGEFTGKGNGVSMKVSPVAALFDLYDENKVVSFIKKLSLMTHRTNMAVISGMTQSFAVRYCLMTNEKEFNSNTFIEWVLSGANIGNNEFPDVCEEKDNLYLRLKSLKKHNEYTTKKIIEDYNGGTCYCYNSLPFTYLFFLKDYDSIDAMYNVIAAGGDTDTNASMVGGLLGALHGYTVFPEHLIATLDEKERKEVLEVSKLFYKSFSKTTIGFS